MKRAAVCAIGVLLAACGGTTELGTERDPTLANGGAGAAGASETAMDGGDGGTVSTGGSDSNPGGAGETSFPSHGGSAPSPECRGKRCGYFCSLGPGSGNHGVTDGFCDGAGECLGDVPECDADRCRVAEDCTHGVPASLRGNCLECSDHAIVCGEVGCIDGFCAVSDATCPQGVAQCNINENCLAVPFIPCEPCPFGPPACPRSRCIDQQCVVQYPRCDEYSPCGGKPCGAICQICAPDDPNCTESEAIKTCNGFGDCVMGTGRCN